VAESVGPSLPEAGVADDVIPDSTAPVAAPAADGDEPEIAPEAQVAPLEEVPAGIPVEGEEERA
jgi:hypothetical protein